MALTTKEREWLEVKFDGINERFIEVNGRFTEVLVEIAKLKVKSGVWGLMGGLIPVLITVGIYFLVR